MRRVRFISLLLCGLGNACSSPSPSISNESSSSDLAAPASEPIHVGTLPILSSDLTYAGLSQREGLIRDTLYSLARFHRSKEIRQTFQRSIAARVLLDSEVQEAEDQGQPSTAELEDAQRALGALLEHDVAVRTSRITAFKTALSDDQGIAAKMRSYRDRLAASHDFDEFIELAGTYRPEDIEIQAVTMGPYERSGRLVPKQTSDYMGSDISSAYAEAISACEDDHVLDHVVEDEKGFYIVYCQEHYPALRPTPEERRSTLQKQVYRQRAAKKLALLSTALRKSTSIQINDHAGHLTTLPWREE
ncbi:MAG: hypothetical protein MK135_00560 [Polyangiaceae bacterium]|nr:hypothetical protein [Polyangiaceae bacterium]